MFGTAPCFYAIEDTVILPLVREFLASSALKPDLRIVRLFQRAKIGSNTETLRLKTYYQTRQLCKSNISTIVVLLHQLCPSRQHYSQITQLSLVFRPWDVSGSLQLAFPCWSQCLFGCLKEVICVHIQLSQEAFLISRLSIA